MWVSFLHFIRWIGSLIPSHAYVKWSNSCCLLHFFLSHFQSLSLSFIRSNLPCILNIRNCYIIPDISHFGALLWHSYLSSLSLTNLLLFQMFWLFQPLLQVEFSSIKTRRGLHSCVHLTKPSSGRWIACSFSISHTHPSLLTVESKMKWAPDWLCVGLGDNKVVSFFLYFCCQVDCLYGGFS